MATGIAAARNAGPLNHFEVCPNWDANAKACTCPKDGGGNPTPAHSTYEFGAVSPDARTNVQWALACTREALALVKAQQPTTPTPLPALVGTSI